MAATPIALGAGTTSDVEVITTSGYARLLGWSVRESGATTGASVIIRSQSGSGPQVGAAQVPVNGTNTAWLGPQGIRCDAGIWVDRTGNTDVTIWVG